MYAVFISSVVKLILFLKIHQLHSKYLYTQSTPHSFFYTRIISDELLQATIYALTQILPRLLPRIITDKSIHATASPLISPYCVHFRTTLHTYLHTQYTKHKIAFTTSATHTSPTVLAPPHYYEHNITQTKTQTYALYTTYGYPRKLLLLHHATSQQLHNYFFTQTFAQTTHATSSHIYAQIIPQITTETLIHVTSDVNMYVYTQTIHQKITGKLILVSSDTHYYFYTPDLSHTMNQNYSLALWKNNSYLYPNKIPP